jgi:hypothetical protein
MKKRKKITKSKLSFAMDDEGGEEVEAEQKKGKGDSEG